MSLTTFSKFYYRYEITTNNNLLNFSEGGAELTATLGIGSYSLQEFVSEIQSAMRTAGALLYVVTVARATRLITISAPSNFEILCGSGTQINNSPFSLMGFSGSNKTGDDSYTGAAAAGSSYEPQFILQDHVATNNFKRAANATVNKTASGRVEVIKFGNENFLQCNIKYITDLTTDGNVILNNASGVSNARDFMDYCITKGPLEYMADKNSPNTYETIILESTPEEKDGTGYKLNELYGQGLPGYFDTGILVFRVVT